MQNFKPENGYFDDFDTRQAAYWALFAGACGHTYGHHGVWSMCTEPSEYTIMTWKEGMIRAGGKQMQFVRNLMESRPFLDLIPDQELIAINYDGANHLQVTKGKDFAFVYSPNGLVIQVNMGRISGLNVKAYWYNPRDGKALFMGIKINSGVECFVPPSSGRNNDWILALDDAEHDYALPGQVV